MLLSFKKKWWNDVVLERSRGSNIKQNLPETGNQTGKWKFRPCKNELSGKVRIISSYTNKSFMLIAKDAKRSLSETDRHYRQIKLKAHLKMSNSVFDIHWYLNTNKVLY